METSAVPVDPNGDILDCFMDLSAQTDLIHPKQSSCTLSRLAPTQCSSLLCEN